MGGAGNTSGQVTSGDSVVSLIEKGNALEEQGRPLEALEYYDAAVRADPRYARAHLNRGNALLAADRVDEARSAYDQAIACDPRYAAAHFNLGNLNCRLQEHEQALEEYQTAVGIKPDFADAFVAMGNLLDNLGRGSEAIESYQRALAINPGYAEIHFNLGLVAHREGRLEQATASLRKAIELRPDYAEAYRALGMVLSRAARAQSMTVDLPARPALTAAINDPWMPPYRLSRVALGQVMLDPTIAGCVQRANKKWPSRELRGLLFGADDLEALAADALLHAVLCATPVDTLEFERFLTVARCTLLETAGRAQPPDTTDGAALSFYAALARQCFINEYVFDCDDSERAAAAACRTKLLALLDSNAAVPPLLLVAVAAYFPLHTLPEPERLLGANQHGPVAEVLRQQIREPLAELTLRAGVQRLTPIADGVSEKVREQYEENPYPRWVRLPVGMPTLRFNAELRRILPLATFTPLADDSQPELLIAGCGTGSQAIAIADQFRDVRILAVDLSLSSIGYAIRKTQERGITNIHYAQADILKLGEITRTFDIIAASGVLHHLADPFEGWRILLSRLRPGGFMNLAFYSQLARRHVVKAREIIAARGYSSTPDDIRRFRRDLAEDGGAELQWLSRTPDFYSTSGVRDLVFHVQEHRLTLDQIEWFLAESGLRFLGFDLDPGVLQQYRTHFSDDQAGTNLRNWARFEADYPDTFFGMYEFWIQRPANH